MASGPPTNHILLSHRALSNERGRGGVLLAGVRRRKFPRELTTLVSWILSLLSSSSFVAAVMSPSTTALMSSGFIVGEAKLCAEPANDRWSGDRLHKTRARAKTTIGTRSFASKQCIWNGWKALRQVRGGRGRVPRVQKRGNCARERNDQQAWSVWCSLSCADVLTMFLRYREARCIELISLASAKQYRCSRGAAPTLAL